jgi:hypothetical protein
VEKRRGGDEKTRNRGDEERRGGEERRRGGEKRMRRKKRGGNNRNGWGVRVDNARKQAKSRQVESDACLADPSDTRAAVAPRGLRAVHSADHPTRPVTDGILVDPDRDGLSKAGVSRTHASSHLRTLAPCILAFTHPHIPTSSHPRILASLHPCILASLHPCILASLHPCILASLHPCILAIVPA